MSAPSPYRIFVVDDDPFYTKLIAKSLSIYPDASIRTLDTGRALLDHLREQPHLITLDYRLPDAEGLELLGKIKARHPDARVVIISEQDKVDTAVALLREGADDYLVKEKDLRERLLRVVDHLRSRRQLEQRVEVLEGEVKQKYRFASVLIGESPGLQKVYSMMEKAAASDINVVISGETGTGKEVVAKAIHYQSARAAGPFVAVNMAAIPRELIESELFGYEKGAFTGASERRIGLLESANGGTLFLDEIGETDLHFQPKLLRALQEREVMRVGGRQRVHFDARLLVATHRDLQAEVQAGRFRSDLYYRLIGIPIDIPPLRERGDDVLLLARHFADRYTSEHGQSPVRFSPEAVQTLRSYPWPGNVRELKAVVELATVMSGDGLLQPSDFQLGAQDVLSQELQQELTLREYTERIIHHFLQRYDGKVRTVAERLDIHPSTIYRLLQREEGDGGSGE
jgi:two-component system, NtrC family, response regulator AtoC